MNQDIRAISLFSGAGGLDVGSQLAGIPVAFCIDIEKDAIETLKINNEFKNTKILNDDLFEYRSEDILRSLDDDFNGKYILIGGAPCQPFSKNGYWVTNKVRKGIDDPRAKLVNEYLRVLVDIQPEGFVFENVESLLHPTNRIIVDEFIKIVESEGYKVKIIKANALDYGVPQKRKRLFIIGTKGNFNSEEPLKTHFPPEIAKDKGLPPYVNVGEVINEFDKEVFFEESEIVKGRYEDELKEIPPGQNYKALTEWAGHSNPKFEADKKFWNFLLKLDPNKPSWTITAQPGPWVGPFHWNSRRLRIPEIAAIQSFPRNYKFYGSRRSIQKQIGNAVPPLMAKAMVKFLKDSLDHKTNSDLETSKPNVISIFSGGGGIDLGFKKAGFNNRYATDFLKEACETLIENNSADVVECKDIREINFSQLKKDLKIENIDCLVGGPPCPAYSKSRFYRKEKKRALEDENSFTLYEYFRAVEELQPSIFFFENVHGFIYKPHKAAFDFLKEKSEELGYEISTKVLNAAEFGVPQTRERFICVGVKKSFGDKFEFPKETHYIPEKYKHEEDKDKLPWVTCKIAIGDLDVWMPEDEKMQAGSKHKDLLKEIPPGDNYLYFTEERGHPEPKFKWRSRYWSFLLKLSPDRPSWTIQASFSNNMGPFHWNNRFLRISEIKRLQSFDDSYNFSGDTKAQWRQIGNAVPPLLVQRIAEEIRNQYFSKNSSTIKKEVDYQQSFF
jgi:DNA (cytosine-5)-methyltransferase 1